MTKKKETFTTETGAKGDGALCMTAISYDSTIQPDKENEKKTLYIFALDANK